jgi:hypothetical protein
MKYLSSIFLLVLSLQAMNQEQINNLRYIYSKTKQFDLGLTMSAIAMTESNLGKYTLNINKDSIDCGIFMLNSKTLSNNKWTQSRICERLIKDKDFSISLALERYKYFYNYYRSKGYSRNLAWKKAICSYNAGWNWEAGIKYYKKVVKNIRLIKGIIKWNLK